MIDLVLDDIRFLVSARHLLPRICALTIGRWEVCQVPTPVISIHIMGISMISRDSVLLMEDKVKKIEMSLNTK